MECIIEIVIEVLVELLLDDGIDCMTNSEYPKYLKYIIAGLTLLVFTAVVAGLIAVGIICMKDSTIVGIVMCAVGVAFAILTIQKIRKLIQMKKK